MLETMMEPMIPGILFQYLVKRVIIEPMMETMM